MYTVILPVKFAARETERQPHAARLPSLRATPPASCRLLPLLPSLSTPAAGLLLHAAPPPFPVDAGRWPTAARCPSSLPYLCRPSPFPLPYQRRPPAATILSSGPPSQLCRSSPPGAERSLLSPLPSEQIARYKKNGIEYYMKKVYGELLYPAKVEELMIAVKKMYASYEPSRSASHHTSSSSNNVEAIELLDDEEKDEYYETLQGNMVDEDGTIASDLDKYMSEPPTVLPNRTAFNKFDVLSWWKTNQEVYPTLCKLGLDVLAIQVSTVASESAFSAGGRVIDPYRSRLDPEIVEALICTKDWIAARKGNKKPGSILKDLDVVETLVANMNLENLLEDKEKQMTVGASESDDDGASPAHGSHKDGEEDSSYDAAMSYA